MRLAAWRACSGVVAMTAPVLAAESDLSRRRIAVRRHQCSPAPGALSAGEHVPPSGRFRRGDIDVRCASAGDPDCRVESEGSVRGVFVGVRARHARMCRTVRRTWCVPTDVVVSRSLAGCPPWSISGRASGAPVSSASSDADRSAQIIGTLSCCPRGLGGLGELGVRLRRERLERSVPRHRRRLSGACAPGFMGDSAEGDRGLTDDRCPVPGVDVDPGRDGDEAKRRTRDRGSSDTSGAGPRGGGSSAVMSSRVRGPCPAQDGRRGDQVGLGDRDPALTGRTEDDDLGVECGQSDRHIRGMRRHTVR